MIGRAEGTTARWIAALALASALVAVPWIASRGTQAVLLTLLLYAALAQTWNLIGGFAGQISLGHSAFVGTGAYVAAMLMLEAGWPLAALFPAAGIAAAAFAWITSVALLRLRGAYFSIATLAVALAAEAWMLAWEFTGASKGLNLPIGDLPEQTTLYFLALALTAAASLVAWWFTWSCFGLRVMAVRDDEDAARSLGVDGTRVKAIVFTLSGFFAGLIGVVVALNQIALVPANLFGLGWTINMLVMTVVGGAGTVAGPFVGAAVVYYLIEKQLENSPDIAALLAGVLIVAVIRFAPGGVWGLASSAVRSLRQRIGGAERQAA